MSPSTRPSVDEVCRQAEEHAEHLSRAENHNSEHWPTTLDNLSRAVSHLVRMTVPLYKAFNNGGLPAKRAGRAFKVKALGIEFSIPYEQAGTWFRWACLMLALLKLAGYQINVNGLLQQRADKEDRRAVVAILADEE